HIEGSGHITDLQKPHIDGEYVARVDLAEAGSIMRLRDLREGEADFRGKGSWSLDDFATSGSVVLRDFGWQDDQVALRKATATADYSVTDDQIAITRLQGKLLGGNLSGDAKIENWLHSVSLSSGQRTADETAVIRAARPKSNKKEPIHKAPGVQSGAVQIHLRD